MGGPQANPAGQTRPQSSRNHMKYAAKLNLPACRWAAAKANISQVMTDEDQTHPCEYNIVFVNSTS